MSRFRADDPESSAASSGDFQTVFDASCARVAWTMTGYTLALATVIPLTGWAADRFGTKRLYMAALLLFTLGSVLCATADSIGQLIAYRVVQGLGGGMLMPLGMTIMTRAAGPQRIGRLMAVLGIPMLLLIAAGFFTFTQVGTDTSYLLLCGALFVMGLGLGGTMMPIMNSALMSVILTNELNNSPAIPGTPLTEAGLAIAAEQNPAVLQRFPAVEPGVVERGLQFVADSFGTTFWVGFAIVLSTLIPAWFLPRRRPATPAGAVEDDRVAAPVIPH